MNRSTACVIFLSIGIAGLVLAQGGIVSWHGIQPNILLIVALIALIPTVNRFLIISLFGSSVLYMAFWMPFWFFEFLGLSACVFAFYFLLRFLTGNTYADFLIGIVAITLAWYGIVALVSHAPFSIARVALDAAYTATVGTVLWFGGARLREIIHGSNASS